MNSVVQYMRSIIDGNRLKSRGTTELCNFSDERRSLIELSSPIRSVRTKASTKERVDRPC